MKYIYSHQKFSAHILTCVFLQGLFFVFMLLASETDWIPYYVPTNLLCITDLAGFIDSVIFWVIDFHARLWLEVKMDNFYRTGNLWGFFDFRDPVDNSDDNSDSTVDFFVGTLGTSSYSAAFRESRNENDRSMTVVHHDLDIAIAESTNI